MCWRVSKKFKNIIWHFENWHSEGWHSEKFQNVDFTKCLIFKTSTDKMPIFQNVDFSKCLIFKTSTDKMPHLKMSNTQNLKFSVMSNSTYFQWLHLQIKKLSILEVQVLMTIITTITGFTFLLHLGLIQKIIWKYLDNIYNLYFNFSHNENLIIFLKIAQILNKKIFLLKIPIFLINFLVFWRGHSHSKDRYLLKKYQFG